MLWKGKEWFRIGVTPIKNPKNILMIQATKTEGHLGLKEASDFPVLALSYPKQTFSKMYSSDLSILLMESLPLGYLIPSLSWQGHLDMHLKLSSCAKVCASHCMSRDYENRTA